MSAGMGGITSWGLNGIFKIFCFTGDTPVQAAEPDGKGGYRTYSRRIDQIKEGDLVLSRNPRNNQVEVKRVTATSKSTAPEIFRLELADSSGRVVEVVKTTRDHPFFVKEKGWSQASRLGIGTSIVTRAGPELVVTRISRIQKPDGVAVYNFTVEDHHTYFVGKALGGIWVHNSGNCSSAADELLKRSASGKESASRLQRLAEESLRNPEEGVFGISVTAGTPRYSPFGTALRSTVEQHFRVHNTPFADDLLHGTVELPNPVTSEVARIWNAIWGFR